LNELDFQFCFQIIGFEWEGYLKEWSPPPTSLRLLSFTLTFEIIYTCMGNHRQYHSNSSSYFNLLAWLHHRHV